MEGLAGVLAMVDFEAGTIYAVDAESAWMTYCAFLMVGIGIGYHSLYIRLINLFLFIRIGRKWQISCFHVRVTRILDMDLYLVCHGTDRTCLWASRITGTIAPTTFLEES